MGLDRVETRGCFEAFQASSSLRNSVVQVKAFSRARTGRGRIQKTEFNLLWSLVGTFDSNSAPDRRSTSDHSTTEFLILVDLQYSKHSPFTPSSSTSTSHGLSNSSKASRAARLRDLPGKSNQEVQRKSMGAFRYGVNYLSHRTPCPFM